MVLIAITPEQSDEVMISELKATIEMQLNSYTDESNSIMEPDFEIIGACKTLLRYYLPTNQATPYINHVEIGENAIKAKMNG